MTSKSASMPPKYNLDLVLKSLAEPVRRDIFQLLHSGDKPLSVTGISDHFKISRQAISKHLRIMEDAQLISSTLVGRRKYCKANTNPLTIVNTYLDEYTGQVLEPVVAVDTSISQAEPPKLKDSGKTGKKKAGKKKKDKDKKKKKKKKKS